MALKRINKVRELREVFSIRKNARSFVWLCFGVRLNALNDFAVKQCEVALKIMLAFILLFLLSPSPDRLPFSSISIRLPRPKSRCYAISSYFVPVCCSKMTVKNRKNQVMSDKLPEVT